MIPVQPKSQQMNYEGIWPCDLRFLTLFNLGIFLPIGKQKQPRLSKNNLKIKYHQPKKLLVSDGDHWEYKPWDLVPEPFQSICCGHC
jgi:hypothetical protein